MNHTIFFIFHDLANQSIFFDGLVIFSSKILGWLMIVGVIYFLFIHSDGMFDPQRPFLQIKNKIRETFFVLTFGFSAWILANIIKALIVAPRPFIVFENLNPLFLHGGFDSFPSGHATLFSALAISVFLRHKKMGFYFILITLVISFSRIIAGIHFPIDILAGWILGTTFALIFNRVFRK